MLSITESVCPECLIRIPAARVQEGEDIYLEKTCPQHGDFRTILWRGAPEFSSWNRPKIPSYPEKPLTEKQQGCPYDCGLCPDHRQHTCSVLIEVTQRCDLHCTVCFADSGTSRQPDLAMPEIARWYRRLVELGGPFNIQLSGGEPCVRDDLPEIIRLGRSCGFTYFQVNTNGLRLARDEAYLVELKKAGLSTVFLQFDGLCDCVYTRLRGRELLDEKMKVIQRCTDAGIGVVLVPTLVPGINVDQIGDILRFALEHMPVVRGVHFQPVSYFGRYPQIPDNGSRITIPEVIHEIEAQTGGLMPGGSFCPPGCENALCSFHANYILMPDSKLEALTRHTGESCCCKPASAAEGAAKTRAFVAENWPVPSTVEERRPANRRLSLGEWDTFVERRRTHSFFVSGMAFQDAWNLDLERLRDCCIHVASADGRLIPFCAYHLTGRGGNSLYR